MAVYPLEIFYDGDCSVCAKEIEHYRRTNPRQRLRFIDIRGEGFSAATYGKRPEEFLARLQLRDGNGIYWSGVDAFVQIWQAYPAGSVYHWLALSVNLPGLRQLARGGYALFARYRHLLPKRRGACRDGSCDLRRH